MAMRKHYIKEDEIRVYKRAGVQIHYDKPYVFLPEVKGQVPKSNSEKRPRGLHIQLTSKVAGWRNTSSVTAIRHERMLKIMEEDPTKVMIRGDLVRRMVLKKEGSHAHIQAFVGDMLTRGLLRYVGE